MDYNTINTMQDLRSGLDSLDGLRITLDNSKALPPEAMDVVSDMDALSHSVDVLMNRLNYET